MADDTFSGPHEAQLRQGFKWLQDNLLNHAEISLGRVLAVDPGNPLARRLHGIALFKLGRRGEALSELKAGAEGGSGAPKAWADYAVALRIEGRREEAEAAYARAVAAQSADAGPAPGLDELSFCTDRARHAFTLVDYPYVSEIRYGSGRPPHPELHAMISAGAPRYRELLDRMGEIQTDFAAVPLGGTYESDDPFWLNGWFPPLDGMALTAILRDGDPQRFVEIGSGVSTKFARRAVQAYGLRTRLTSIDPQPRNQIDRLCDEVIRSPLEQCPPTVFEALEPGDICFLDSSHRSFQGSDVTVFFLEILPRLKPGVIVHIHDIYLPDDYISGHVGRLWNEQYLLATALLFGGDRFEILFPGWFVGQDAGLREYAGRRLKLGPLAQLELYGASFWMRRL